MNVVREDPVRRGLLYAGTERGVYVSFDDGDHWHSLQPNLPATSVRDIDVHGDDLVIATHGRGFWIIDDVSPLRAGRAGVGDVPFQAGGRGPQASGGLHRHADAERRADGCESAVRRIHRLRDPFELPRSR